MNSFKLKVPKQQRKIENDIQYLLLGCNQTARKSHSEAVGTELVAKRIDRVRHHFSPVRLL